MLLLRSCARRMRVAGAIGSKHARARALMQLNKFSLVPTLTHLTLSDNKICELTILRSYAIFRCTCPSKYSAVLGALARPSRSIQPTPPLDPGLARQWQGRAPMQYVRPRSSSAAGAGWTGPERPGAAVLRLRRFPHLQVFNGEEVRPDERVAAQALFSSLTGE